MTITIAGRAFTVHTEQVEFAMTPGGPVDSVTEAITFTGPNGAGYTPVKTRKPGVYQLVSFKGGPWRKHGNLVLITRTEDGTWKEAS